MHYPNLLNANRVLHALTQAEVGSLLGLSDDAISNYELAVRLPGLSVILGLSLIYGKPASQLFPDALRQVADDMTQRFAPLSVKIQNDTSEAAAVRQAFAASFGPRLITLTSGA